MKHSIAIHKRQGSFTDRWISYCEMNAVPFILVDCHSDDIIKTLSLNNVTHLLWHINHDSYRDIQTYPYVLNSADLMGIKTFPNYESRWHFDDKIAQKHLLESIKAPLVPSYVFYYKDTATSYLKSCNLPIVVKLRKGAGAVNVRLIHSIEEGISYINMMFSTGANTADKLTSNISGKINLAKKVKNPITLIKKVISRLCVAKEEGMMTSNEKGYLYAQNFLSGNDFDTRIIVVGNKAFGIRRLNRENDFRASGSGKISYDYKEIDVKMVRIAFDTSKTLNFQCMAYDFVYNHDAPQIIELCFGFAMLAYDKCPGYWSEKLEFIEGSFNPQYFMIEDLLQKAYE
jgi:hypothetical protein